MSEVITRTVHLKPPNGEVTRVTMIIDVEELAIKLAREMPRCSSGRVTMGRRDICATVERGYSPTVTVL